MKTNVGSIDRLIRIIIGLAITVVGLIYESYWGVLGIAILATGLFGFCLIYSVLGIGSARKES